MKLSLSLGKFQFTLGASRPAPLPQKRSYSAGAVGRLTSDWGTTITSADVEVRNDVTKLRARCRELERDDPYARRYIKLLKNNVLGSDGIRLEMKVQEAGGAMRFTVRLNDMNNDPFMYQDFAATRDSAAPRTRWLAPSRAARATLSIVLLPVPA